ncbi:hypothetical protein D9M69_734760 [compost metagenome]
MHDIVAHHGLEQLLLVLKVQVQGAFRHTGPFGHILQARRCEAPFDKQVEGGGEQFLRAGILAPLPAGLGINRGLHVSFQVTYF